MAASPDHPVELSPPVSDEVRKTTCYMCACRCGVDVHMRDGKVRYLQGNRDHPVNRGVLCAKGSAGIMQHYSPARLKKPLKRVAHGGFCSVNMAAAGIYTMGGAFWEFGSPDWELTEYFMIFGVAEDHDSNPIKIGLGKLKARGAKIVAVNPVRTGYNAIADEWVGITPGTDGLFVLALVQELIRAGKVDLDYLMRYTNAAHLVIQNPGAADHGLFARDGEGNFDGSPPRLPRPPSSAKWSSSNPGLTTSGANMIA